MRSILTLIALASMPALSRRPRIGLHRMASAHADR